MLTRDSGTNTERSGGGAAGGRDAIIAQRFASLEDDIRKIETNPTSCEVRDISKNPVWGAAFTAEIITECLLGDIKLIKKAESYSPTKRAMLDATEAAVLTVYLSASALKSAIETGIEDGYLNRYLNRRTVTSATTILTALVSIAKEANTLFKEAAVASDDTNIERTRNKALDFKLTALILAFNSPSYSSSKNTVAAMAIIKFIIEQKDETTRDRLLDNLLKDKSANAAIDALSTSESFRGSPNLKTFLEILLHHPLVLEMYNEGNLPALFGIIRSGDRKDISEIFASNKPWRDAFWNQLIHLQEEATSTILTDPSASIRKIDESINLLIFMGYRDIIRRSEDEFANTYKALLDFKNGCEAKMGLERTTMAAASKAQDEVARARMEAQAAVQAIVAAKTEATEARKLTVLGIILNVFTFFIPWLVKNYQAEAKVKLAVKAAIPIDITAVLAEAKAIDMATAAPEAKAASAMISTLMAEAATKAITNAVTKAEAKSTASIPASSYAPAYGSSFAAGGGGAAGGATILAAGVMTAVAATTAIPSSAVGAATAAVATPTISKATALMLEGNSITSIAQ